jgi:hypothetical protein
MEGRLACISSPPIPLGYMQVASLIPRRLLKTGRVAGGWMQGCMVDPAWNLMNYRQQKVGGLQKMTE